MPVPPSHPPPVSPGGLGGACATFLSTTCLPWGIGGVHVPRAAFPFTTHFPRGIGGACAVCRLPVHHPSPMGEWGGACVACQHSRPLLVSHRAIGGVLTAITAFPSTTRLPRWIGGECLWRLPPPRPSPPGGGVHGVSLAPPQNIFVPSCHCSGHARARRYLPVKLELTLFSRCVLGISIFGLGRLVRQSWRPDLFRWTR